MMGETYKYGLKDLNGNPIPDSSLSPTGHDMFDSTGDYEKDLKLGSRCYQKPSSSKISTGSMVCLADVKLVSV